MNKLVYQWVAKAFREFPLQASLLLALSLLTSVADGLSITLLIPLLATLFEGQGFAGSGGGRLVDMLQRAAMIAGPENRLEVIAGLIVGLVTLRSVLSYWDSRIVTWMSGQISHQIRSRIHANLLGVDYQFIFVNDNGQLLNTLDGETWHTTEAITSVFGLFTNLCMVIAFTTILLFISWELTLLVAILVMVISLLRRTIDKRIRLLGEQVLKASEDLSSRSCELFDSMRMIRAFSRESQAQRAYEEASLRLFGLNLRINNLGSFASATQEVLYALVFASMIFVAIGMGIGGAALVAFLALLHRLQPHVKQFDETRTNLLALAGSVGAVSRLLELEQWSGRARGQRTLPKLTGGVRFDDVTFSYAGKARERRNALDALTLFLPFGKTTAIVGSSGAGKSTLTNLLFRFHDPEAGSISVDGVPLQDIDLGWWRSQLSISGQDTDLVSGTLRENIAYARPDADDAAIEEAARAADIHDFIVSLPMGYKTQVGTRGVLLSGGQRQRIQLARALLRKDGILILDEATNALDSMTESEVFKAFESLHGKRTIIIIAHRLSTTRMADQVIVLANGRVAEQGPPSELYRSGGIFAKMVELQELSYMINSAEADPDMIAMPRSV
jgi:ABC-type multidrug transport system fused ATPase/permease subunit